MTFCSLVVVFYTVYQQKPNPKEENLISGITRVHTSSTDLVVELHDVHLEEGGNLGQELDVKVSRVQNPRH